MKMLPTMSASSWAKNNPVKYKALILDLDDTTVLHGRGNMPSPRVADAIAKAKEKIHVCVATSRTLIETHEILDHLSLSGPCVVTGGAQVYDPVGKKVLHEVVVPHDLVERIFSIAQAHTLLAVYYDGNSDVPYKKGDHPSKVLSVYLPQVEPDRVDAMVQEFSIDSRIHVQKLSAWDKKFMSLDITGSMASKLHGILEVARILDIKTEEIIGVGDGYNDFPLLMACGLKIAMGNAVPELKAIADFVAPTVEEDGVATVIEKFILSS
jgi:HAD superfamily hydrolase (TIGR01484 family)